MRQVRSVAVLGVALAASGACAQCFTEFAAYHPSTVFGVTDWGYAIGTAHGEEADHRATIAGEDTTQDLGTLGGENSEGADISSGAGSAVGGADDALGHERPFRWTYLDDMEDLGDLGGSTGFANAISYDGDAVAGWSADDQGRSIAFRWTPQQGMVGLGTLGGDESAAFGISGDGTVTVGWADDAGSEIRAFRHTAEEGMVGLGTLPGGGSSRAEAADLAGEIIVGSALDAGGKRRAFRWTGADGMTALADLPGGLMAEALDISLDGSIIVGTATDADGPHAVVWDADGAIHNVAVEFAEFIPDGWTLERAEAVSPDGTIIGGAGTGEYGAMGWTLNRIYDCFSQCYPDLNGDGVLDLFDFLAFVNEFNAGGNGADCDGDGVLDLFDFLCFTNTFNAGC